MPFRIPLSNSLFLISQFTTAADASSKTIIWSRELIWTLCQGLIFSFSPQAPRGWGSRFYSQKQVCENEYKGGGKLKSDFENAQERAFLKSVARKLKSDKWVWVLSWSSTYNCPPALSHSPTDHSTSNLKTISTVFNQRIKDVWTYVGIIIWGIFEHVIVT